MRLNRMPRRHVMRSAHMGRSAQHTRRMQHIRESARSGAPTDNIANQLNREELSRISRRRLLDGISNAWLHNREGGSRDICPLVRIPSIEDLAVTAGETARRKSGLQRALSTQGPPTGKQNF
jgi:hypothetical protein